MPHRVLIVEDESLVALELEGILEDLGHSPVGIAADSSTAIRLAALGAEIALVDLNLRDGPTGPLVGARLSDEFGVKVLFMTANPSQLGNGVAGTVGVLPKPYCADEVRQVLDFITGNSAHAPQSLRIFA